MTTCCCCCCYDDDILCLAPLPDLGFRVWGFGANAESASTKRVQVLCRISDFRAGGAVRILVLDETCRP